MLSSSNFSEYVFDSSRSFAFAYNFETVESLVFLDELSALSIKSSEYSLEFSDLRFPDAAGIDEEEIN